MGFFDTGRSVLDEPTYEGVVSSFDAPGIRAWKLYEYAKEAQRLWADRATDLLGYYNGAHWTKAQKAALLERGQKPVAIQTVYQLTEQAVDMLTSNRPSFRATAIEDSDTRTADVWSDLFQHMWVASRGQPRFRSVTRDNYVMGRGVAYAHVDPNMDFGKGEVVFRDLEPRNIFPDPASIDPLWDDAGFVVSRSTLTFEQLHQLHPGIAGEMKRLRSARINFTDNPWGTNQTGVNDEIIEQTDIANHGHRSKYEVLELFEKVKRPHYRVFNPDAGIEEVLDQTQYDDRRAHPAYIVNERGVDQLVTDKRQVEQLDGMYQQLGPVFHLVVDQPFVDGSGQMQQPEPRAVPGPEDEASIPGSTTVMMPTTIGALIDRGDLPVTPFLQDRIKVSGFAGKMAIYEPFILPTSHYPTVAFPAGSNRNPYPISEVARVRDLQDIINKSQSLILAHAANSTNVKVFYPDGSIKDVDNVSQEWGRAGTAMIPYEPAYGLGGSSPGGIVIAAPPPLPGALYENMDRAVMLMERTLGIFSIQAGDPTSAPPTFRGTLAIDDMGQRRIKGKMDQLYASLERLGNVMKDLAQHTYTERKVLRILQPNGQRRESAINYRDVSDQAYKINDVTVGHYDIMVVGGSTLHNNRLAKSEMYLEFYDRGLVDDRAVLQHSDFPDADEILERNSVMSQMQQTLQQYDQQLQELQGDMQTAQRETMHAKQRAELEKFKAKLAAMSAEVRANVTSISNALDSEKEKQTALMRERSKQKQQEPAQQQ